jgi:homoserine O-succinyltransferase
MAIILPPGLPAAATLRREGVAVRERADGASRTLSVALVNLMPDRPTTETQFARLLGGAAIDVALTLVVPDTHDPKTTSPSYIAAFYRRWSEIAGQRFDGLIVTGAPVEHLDFEAVHYWRELSAIFGWAAATIRGSYLVCWAAQAALFHFHGVPKHALPRKAFGVYPQRVMAFDAPLLRGLGASFPTPVSRHTEVRRDDLPREHGLVPLAESARSGLCLVEDRRNRAVCMFNHLEYDPDTLMREYLRDGGAGAPVAPPEGYCITDASAIPPRNSWRQAAEILFANWLSDIAAPERATLASLPPCREAAFRYVSAPRSSSSVCSPRACP